jgi:hypothetical protein
MSGAVVCIAQRDKNVKNGEKRMKSEVEKGHEFVTDWQLAQPSPRFEFPWRGAAIIAVVFLAAAIAVWVGCSTVAFIDRLGAQRDITLNCDAE